MSTFGDQASPTEFAIEDSVKIESRVSAMHRMAENGGTPAEGPYYDFLIAPGEKRLTDNPKEELVYKVEHHGFPGNANLLNQDRRLDRGMSFHGDYVTDDPAKLARYIENGTGLTLGPKLDPAQPPTTQTKTSPTKPFSSQPNRNSYLDDALNRLAR